MARSKPLRVIETPMLHLTGRLFRERTVWVAHCPELDLVTHGTSPEDARKALREAIAAFLESCAARGTLEEILKERGLPSVGPGVDLDKKREFPVHLDFLQGEQFAVRVAG